MQELQLVGVHEDGEHLLLKAPDGERFRLRIDEALRAAARRDRARLGQLQIATQQMLRPREIQTRIRAGESADDIALAAGMPVEHVRRYEGPVLAERAHVAERAGRQVVRTSGPDRGVPLATLVAERLAARGVDGGAWDSWRADDGRWVVQLAFRAGSKERRARWAFDLTTGALEPVDDEGRWLSAAQPLDDELVPGRRLAAVRERVYDVEADGGVREAHGDDGTAQLLEELRGRRGRRQPVLTPAELAQLDADAAPPGAHPAASAPDEAVDAEILALPEPRSEHDQVPAAGAPGGEAGCVERAHDTAQSQIDRDQTAENRTDQNQAAQAQATQAQTTQAQATQAQTTQAQTTQAQTTQAQTTQAQATQAQATQAQAAQNQPDSDATAPDDHVPDETVAASPLGPGSPEMFSVSEDAGADAAPLSTPLGEATPLDGSREMDEADDGGTHAHADANDEPSPEEPSAHEPSRDEPSAVDPETPAVAASEQVSGQRQAAATASQGRNAAPAKRRSRGSRGGGGGAKPRRASVPSWDEIVFGARGGDQSG